MIFHLAFDIPEPAARKLDHESPDLTAEEWRILKDQIRKNSLLVDEYVDRLDLLVNKERYPHREEFIQRIRRRLNLLMEENDTFRKVLWRHYRRRDLLNPVRPRIH